jgi:hypothetical protein
VGDNHQRPPASEAALAQATRDYYDARSQVGDAWDGEPAGDLPDVRPEQRRMESALRRVVAGRRALEGGLRRRGHDPHRRRGGHPDRGHRRQRDLPAPGPPGLPLPRALLSAADAFALSALPGDFEAGFACGFFHLVPRRRRAEFLAGFHGRLVPGARVFLCASVTRTLRAKRRLLPSSDGGDVLCNRQLKDGRSYVIVNNDFDQDELQRVFPPLARDLEVEVGDAWWWVSYSLAPGAPAP